ncbi:hypothetical protein L0156_28635 [bacterium]|nr:hypothetical protein [bacterium]
MKRFLPFTVFLLFSVFAYAASDFSATLSVNQSSVALTGQHKLEVGLNLLCKLAGDTATPKIKIFRSLDGGPPVELIPPSSSILCSSTGANFGYNDSSSMPLSTRRAGYRVILDPANLVAETNENNNEASTLFEMPQHPDLLPGFGGSVRLTDLSLRAVDTVLSLSVPAIVKNIGSSSSVPCINRILFDGSLVGTWSSGIIPPGQSELKDVPIVITLRTTNLSKPHKITLKIDTDNKNDEWDFRHEGSENEISQEFSAKQ